MLVLWSKISAQGWVGLFSVKEAVSARSEIVEFFRHFSFSRGCITSRVGKTLVVFDFHKLGFLLEIPCEGFSSC